MRNQYYHTEGGYQNALMKQIVRHFDVTPEDMYHWYYFEVLNTLIGEIERRLGSPSFTFYAKVESVLENAALGKDVSTEDIKEIVQHFKEDLVECDLIAELKMVENVYCEKYFGYKDFKERIILYSYARYLCHSKAIIFFTKTHQTLLRTTMKQERLNHLMMIYIHQDKKIITEEAMNEFIMFNDERMRVFGKPQQK